MMIRVSGGIHSFIRTNKNTMLHIVMHCNHSFIIGKNVPNDDDDDGDEDFLQTKPNQKKKKKTILLARPNYTIPRIWVHVCLAGSLYTHIHTELLARPIILASNYDCGGWNECYFL